MGRSKIDETKGLFGVDLSKLSKNTGNKTTRKTVKKSKRK